MSVELLMENIYKNKPLTTSTSDHIYELGSLKLENGIKSYSRFNSPILTSTYDPYKITLGFLRNLHKRVTVVCCAPADMYDIDDAILCCSTDKVIVNEFPKKFIDNGTLITDRGDITGLGLWAFMFGRHYGDLYFKVKIEDSLKKIGFKQTRFGSKEVFLYEKSSRYNLIHNITRYGDFNRFGELFFWRD